MLDWAEMRERECRTEAGRLLSSVVAEEKLGIRVRL